MASLQWQAGRPRIPALVLVMAGGKPPSSLLGAHPFHRLLSPSSPSPPEPHPPNLHPHAALSHAPTTRAPHPASISPYETSLPGRAL